MAKKRLAEYPLRIRLEAIASWPDMNAYPDPVCSMIVVGVGIVAEESLRRIPTIEASVDELVPVAMKVAEHLDPITL